MRNGAATVLARLLPAVSLAAALVGCEANGARHPAAHATSPETPRVHLALASLPEPVESAVRAAVEHIDASAQGGGMVYRPGEPTAADRPTLMVVQPDAEAPSVSSCELLDGGRPICAGARCSDVRAHRAPVILCDAGYLERLHRLMTLLGSEPCWSPPVRHDAGFIRLLEQATSRPWGATDERPGGIGRAGAASPSDFPCTAAARTASPGADPARVRGRFIALMVFVLGHELGHVAAHERGHAMSAPGRDVGRRFVRAKACLAHELLRGGAQGGYRAHAAASSVGRRWTRELEADDFGARVLAVVVSRSPDPEAMEADAAGALTMLGLDRWYRSVGRFLNDHCPDLAAGDFALARCLSRRAAHERMAELFDKKHPPMPFRMRRALQSVFGPGGLEADPAPPWVHHARIANAAAGRIAQDACSDAAARPRHWERHCIAYPSIEGAVPVPTCVR